MSVGDKLPLDTSVELHSFQVHVYGIAIVLIPIIVLGSTLAFIFLGDGINFGVVGGTIGVWATDVRIGAFIGNLRLVEPEFPRDPLIVISLVTIGFQPVRGSISTRFLRRLLD